MRRTLCIVGVLPLVATATACLGDLFAPNDAGRLAEARERWSALLVQSYEIDFARGGCECLPESALPVRLHIDLDSIISAVRQSDAEPIPQEDLTLYLTVEDVFDRIAEAIGAHAFRVNVDYDPDFGFPTHVEMNIDEMIADDEVTYSMGNLEIITTVPRNPQP